MLTLINDAPLQGCRGNLYIPRKSSSSNDGDDNDKNNNKKLPKNHLTEIEVEEEEITAASLEKCYQLQKMNYHISQLPFAPQCPPAPLLGTPVSLNQRK